MSNQQPQKISGYWENWRGAINPGKGGSSDPNYYINDIADINHVIYSFLTLDKAPNPDHPNRKCWDGQAIYESMSADDILKVMTKTDPPWENPDEWQRVKIVALIQATHNNRGKFIWAIGGWSDLTKTLQEDQILLFVERCVSLLRITGDGIDFDWEHLSEDPEISMNQRAGLAKTMLALRHNLDKEGMSDKQIGYTTRFNAFWDDMTRPEGFKAYPSDGEGLTIEHNLVALCSSLNSIVDWANIMMYDVPPSDLDSPKGFTLATYKTVLDSVNKCLEKGKIIMGFEPGGQAAGGQWEGMKVDKEVINFIRKNNYGGVMFWAMNQPLLPPSTETTGINAQKLAQYANSVFNEIQ